MKFLGDEEDKDGREKDKGRIEEREMEERKKKNGEKD